MIKISKFEQYLIEANIEFQKLKNNKVPLTDEEHKLKFNLEDNSRGFWWKLVEAARKEFKIYFDLENLDTASTGIHEYKSKKGITFLYQQWWSGGDWETPSILYCCQRINDRSYDPKKQFNCFVFIPNNKEGNPQLIKDSKSKNLVPLDDQDKIKADETLCLKSLKTYLDKI